MPKKQTEPKNTVTVNVRLSGRKMDTVDTTVEIALSDLNLGDRVTTGDLADAAREKIIDEAEIDGKAVFAFPTIDPALEIEQELDKFDDEQLYRGAREKLAALIKTVKVTNGREALAELKALRNAASV